MSDTGANATADHCVRISLRNNRVATQAHSILPEIPPYMLSSFSFVSFDAAESTSLSISGRVSCSLVQAEASSVT